jgi:heme-degrading monooxygenase HmoA
VVTILIRRCVRRDKEKEFIEGYKSQSPTEAPGFISERLTKVRDSNVLPEPMRSFKVASENCVTYINIARWESMESFIAHFNPKNTHEPEVETEDRVRVVLDEI